MYCYITSSFICKENEFPKYNWLQLGYRYEIISIDFLLIKTLKICENGICRTLLFDNLTEVIVFTQISIEYSSPKILLLTF